MGHVCPWWCTYTFDNALRRWLCNPERELTAHVSPGDRVLDIGCGFGFHSEALSRLVDPEGEIVLLDVQQQMLDRAHRRCTRRPDHAKVSAVLQSADKMAPSDPFDFVLMYWVLHEIEDQAALWANLREQSGGQATVLVAEPKIHIGRRQFIAEMDLARRAGFEVCDTPGAFTSHTALAQYSGALGVPSESNGL